MKVTIVRIFPALISWFFITLPFSGALDIIKMLLVNW